MRTILSRMLVTALVAALVLVVGVSVLPGAPMPGAGDRARLVGPRLLVIAPHPDDETIGTGGAIAAARRLGWHVTVVLVTNGDGFVEALRKRGGPEPSPEAMRQLGLRRAEESRRGTSALGVEPDDLIFLGFPDARTMRLLLTNWDADKPLDALTGVSAVPYDFARNQGAPYTGASLDATLKEIITTTDPTTVLFPDPSDRHRDHRAIAAFTQAAMEETGYDGVRLTYLVHRLGFPVTLGNRPSAPLEPPRSLAAVGTNWRQLPLGRRAQAAKREALTHYRSQLAIERQLLESFVRSTELYGTPPELTVGTDSSATIGDPTGDTPERQILPAADIASLQVLKSGQAVRLVLHLKGALSPDVTYALHARSLSPTDTRSFDAHISDGRLSVEQPSASSVSTGYSDFSASADQISVTLPLELTRSARSMLIEADTAANGRSVDFTAWRLLRFKK